MDEERTQNKLPGVLFASAFSVETSKHVPRCAASFNDGGAGECSHEERSGDYRIGYGS